MGRKRFAKDPLLYIDQPIVGTPEAIMQYDYHTPKDEKVVAPIKSTQQKKVNQRPLRRNFLVNNTFDVSEEKVVTEDLSIDETVVEKVTAPKEESLISKDNKFKDMTIDEKIAYLSNLPDHILRVKCEVQTENEAYKGIITDSIDDHVFIQVGRRSSSISIPYSEIISIRMLGF